MKKLFIPVFLGLILFAFTGCNDTDKTTPEDDSSPDVIEDQTPESPGDDALPVCNKCINTSKIPKPTGVFTSVLTPSAVVNDTLNGGLIRATWADIEPTPGVFDFTTIEDRLALLPQGKHWSLGIHGGYCMVDEDDPDLYDLPSDRPTITLKMSPSWLVDDFGVETFNMEFRNVGVTMPKYWDSTLQNRLSLMIQAVADHYKNDERLILVYVPQMTANGIEGHFNGVPDETLLEAAGLNPPDADSADQFEDIWVEAALTASQHVASAFDNKAVAFEVHEVIGRVSIPQAIMDGLISDASLNHRVGVAMWWISGKSDYQPELVNALRDFEGDLYGQVISNSSQSYRFLNTDYTEVFNQAKDLCMRYIEPWNYEFENGTFDEEMAAFNDWAATSFE